MAVQGVRRTLGHSQDHQTIEMVEEYAAVDQSTTVPIAGPMAGGRDALTDLPGGGARRLFGVTPV